MESTSAINVARIGTHGIDGCFHSGIFDVAKLSSFDLLAIPFSIRQASRLFGGDNFDSLFLPPLQCAVVNCLALEVNALRFDL